MQIVPPVRTARFEQLEPGELFTYMDGQYAFFALKTQEQSGNRSSMVLFGPSFPGDVAESFIASWQPITVLLFGKSYSILLSTDPATWSPTGSDRKPVCLAVADERIYIYTNGGPSAQHYFPCFVDIKTGEIIQRRPGGSPVFTNSWEIAALQAHAPPRSLLI